MDSVIEMLPPANPWEAIAAGEYAIVELFGHTTLVGRIAEVERFGARMMAIEPLFNGTLLGSVYHGGAAIYRLTPCSREIAWKQQPKSEWHLPSALRAIVPQAALPAPAVEADTSGEDGGDPDDKPF